MAPMCSFALFGVVFYYGLCALSPQFARCTPSRGAVAVLLIYRHKELVVFCREFTVLK